MTPETPSRVGQTPFTLAASEAQNAGLPPGIAGPAPSVGPADLGCASLAPVKQTMPLRGTVEQHLAALQAQEAQLPERQRQHVEYQAVLGRMSGQQPSEPNRQP